MVRDAGIAGVLFQSHTVIALDAILETSRWHMDKISTKKYCCGSNNALMIVPLWPMKRRGKKWFMALFQCKCCHEYSLRGVNQQESWNTFVEILTKERALEFIKEKKDRRIKCGKRN